MDGIPYEIERKFLIKYPKPEFLARCDDISTIEQTYLVPGERGGTERVRKRGREGAFVYTHTEKIRINDMRRVELEEEISREQYEGFLERADKSRSKIAKQRICYYYKEQMFEIDLFPFWQDRAIMEIELRDEKQAVSFPPELEIIKEVTSDRRYTNSSMAAAVPYEEL